MKKMRLSYKNCHLFNHKKQLQNKSNTVLVNAQDMSACNSSWPFTGRSESTEGPHVARGPGNAQVCSREWILITFSSLKTKYLKQQQAS